MRAAGLAGAHPGLQDRILLNYQRIENVHMYAKKVPFFLGIAFHQTFSFIFALLRNYQMPDCFYVNNC